MIFAIDVKKQVSNPNNYAVVTIWKADDSGDVEWFAVTNGQIDDRKYVDLFLRNGYVAADAKRYGTLFRRLLAALQQIGEMPDVPMYYISFNIMPDEKHLSIEIPSTDNTYTVEFDAVDTYMNGIRNKFLRAEYDNAIAASEGTYVNNLQRVLFS